MSPSLRARVAVCLLFVALGVTNAAWSSRIPEIRHNIGVDNATWGVAGTSSAVGDLVAIVVTMVLIGRTRTRRLTRVGAVLMLVSGPLLAGASALVVLVAGLVLWGFGATLLNTAINAQAVDVETVYGRRVIPFFHASYSCGVLVGGVYGAVSAAAGMSPGLQLGASSSLFGLLFLITVNWLPNEPPHAESRDVPLKDRLRNRWAPQLRLLALLAFVGSFIEGTVGQWSALYATDTAGSGAALAAGIYTCFTVAILAARLSGDLVLKRVSLRVFLTCSLLVAGAGVATAVLWPTTGTVIAGFVVAGLGIGCVMPSVIRLAGRQPDISAGEGVSMVTLGQWPGFLLASPVIGLLAGAASLRGALTLVILFGVGGAFLARNVRVPAARGTVSDAGHA
ncbi:major facilitator superfamily MFS_1 [Actinobacteria bacterium OK074]|nr:major facilitator superfamily MFS_1 [Actinobacteria bacterium OK074]